MNTRVVPFSNNKLIAKRTDPYGFWCISFERGSPPEQLKGQYTSFEEAFKDIRIYLENRKEPDVPERPVDVKTK